MTEPRDERYLEFIEDFRASIRERQTGEVDAENVLPVIPREEAFTAEFLSRLADGGDLPDLDAAYYEGKIGRANAQINAYGLFLIDGRVDLAVTIHGESDSDDVSPSIPASQIVAGAKRALHTFRSAAQPIHDSMEATSEATDLFKLLHDHHEQINRVRVIVLVDGIAREAELEQPEELPRVQMDVWDHIRLVRVCSSGLPYEAVTINLMSYVDEPLPCVETGVEAEDHKCLLTVFPAVLIHDLYDDYGARLLELNVRSFLQARGKVNKGIRDTLRTDPDHFFTFNNGLSVTVEELKLKELAGGSRGIVSMTGLQIVNGGQTTASIHRAMKLDKTDLSRVRVQAKITVVKPEHLDQLVPQISRYSNTQNAVNTVDFSANHPYHVQLQQLSERVWAPGETTRWFYERARGQWETARSREGNTPARKRAFDLRTPKQQKIDKTLLAKSQNSWNQKPHVVSRGGQKNFCDLMENLGESLPDESEYRAIVAKVILFKAAEKIARQIGFSAYRANAITYTVALLAFRTSNRIDLDQIWQDQSISPLLQSVLREWMPEVHETITATAIQQGKNVTEWAKKPDAWAAVQALQVVIPDELQQLLREGLPLPNVGSFRESGVVRALTEEEVRRQELVMAMTSDDFAKLFKRLSRYLGSHGMRGGSWNAMTGSLSTVQTYAENQWARVPSPKQTKQILKAMEFLKEREGGGSQTEEM